MTHFPPTTIPSAKKQSAIYLPEIHHKEGNYFPEVSRDNACRWQIVADIASAQYECVSRVIAFDPETGCSEDASAEIARDVLFQVLDERGEVPAWCADFLERHLGVQTVALAQFEAAA